MSDKIFDVGGSKSLMYAVDERGKYKPIKVDNDGNLAVTKGEGQASEGQASEAKQIETNLKLDTVIIRLESGNSILSASMGNLGGKYIANTSETIPDTGYIFNAIQVLADCSITAVGNITGITGITLEAGTIIYGRYTSVTLSSGSVMAYNGEQL